MATLNTAEHFRIDHLIGSISPGRYADLILSRSIERIVPEYVFVSGRLRAKGGGLLVEPKRGEYPESLRRTLRLHRRLGPGDFRIRADEGEHRVRVIELIRDQIVNRASTAVLTGKDGFLEADMENDILPIFCVERYGKNGNIGCGMISGFSLKRGAIAGSVAHDHHNIMVVGTDPNDMLAAVAALAEAQGGFVAVADGEVISLLPLPLCGLMSEEPMEKVDAGLSSVREAARGLGCRLPAPFMTLSFVSLPTVPELGITDRGLIDVRRSRIVPLFID